jgi:hypothetical protein
MRKFLSLILVSLVLTAGGFFALRTVSGNSADPDVRWFKVSNKKKTVAFVGYRKAGGVTRVVILRKKQPAHLYRYFLNQNRVSFRIKDQTIYNYWIKENSEETLIETPFGNLEPWKLEDSIPYYGRLEAFEVHKHVLKDAEILKAISPILRDVELFINPNFIATGDKSFIDDKVTLAVTEVSAKNGKPIFSVQMVDKTDVLDCQDRCLQAYNRCVNFAPKECSLKYMDCHTECEKQETERLKLRPAPAPTPTPTPNPLPKGGGKTSLGVIPGFSDDTYMCQLCSPSWLGGYIPQEQFPID